MEDANIVELYLSRDESAISHTSEKYGKKLHALAKRITEDEFMADECENDLVITSQHIGARPEHALWQGKVFSLSGKSNRYPDFRSSTGYGTAAGLCGVNCRHSFSPYFPGMSLKPDEQISLTENRRQYELEQEQRFNERRIRYFKREAMVYEAGGIDPTKSNAKVAYWQEQQRDLIKANPSLHRDYFREKVE